MRKRIESAPRFWYTLGMKEDWTDLNVEALELPPAAETDDVEILSSSSVFNPDADDIEAVDEVPSADDEEIVVGDIAAEDWHRAVKHLNRRVGELEEQVARLEAMLRDLRKD